MRILGTPDAEYYVPERLADLIDQLSTELSAVGRTGRVTVPAHMADLRRNRYVRNHWAEIRIPAALGWGQSEPAPDPLGTQAAAARLAATLHQLAPDRYPAVAVGPDADWAGTVTLEGP